VTHPLPHLDLDKPTTTISIDNTILTLLVVAMAAKKKKTVNLMLRLPPDLHAGLVEAAEFRGVSLNHEIVSALRVHLDPHMVTWDMDGIRSMIDDLLNERMNQRFGGRAEGAER
jgi:hypothetical protein